MKLNRINEVKTAAVVEEEKDISFIDSIQEVLKVETTEVRQSLG